MPWNSHKMDFTKEQFEEYYGPISNRSNWQPDFTKWVAVLWSEEDYERWCISPKVFWETNGYVPDHPIGFEIEGFDESSEHTLDSTFNLQEQAETLHQLGF